MKASNWQSKYILEIGQKTKKITTSIEEYYRVTQIHNQHYLENPSSKIGLLSKQRCVLLLDTNEQAKADEIIKQLKGYQKDISTLQTCGIPRVTIPKAHPCTKQGHIKKAKRKWSL